MIFKKPLLFFNNNSILEKSYTSIIIRIIILLSSVIVMYQNDLSIIFEKATSFSSANIANFVLVLPALMGYIIYRNRKDLLRLITSQNQRRFKFVTFDEIVGMILIICGVALFFYGSSSFYVLEYHVVSLIILSIGATNFLFNFSVFKKIIFVFVFAAFLIPIPSEFITSMVSPISVINTTAIHDVLNYIFGIPVISDYISGYPTITAQNLTGEQFTWHIGESSSGLYSMVTLSSLGLFLAYLLQGKIWKRILIFSLGFPVLFFLNIIRISIMISLWYHFDENVSELFHAVSGSLMIALGTLVLLVAGTKIFYLKLYSKLVSFSQNDSSINYKIPNHNKISSNNFTTNKKDLSQNKRLCQNSMILNSSKVGIVLILIVIVFATQNLNTTTTNALLTDHTMKKESINLTLLDGPESTILLPTIENWNLEYSSRDTTFENDADMYLALWLKYTETYENPFFINTKPVLFGGVEVWDFVHRWESSLVWAGRPAADIFDQKDIQISDSTTGRLVVYQMPNTEKTDAVLYWIKEIPFINNHNVERKYVHLVVWSNTDYLKSINLIEKADDTQSIEKLFLSLAIPMDSYWSKEGITLITNSENNLELVGLSSDDNYNDNDNHNKQSSNHIQHNSESKIIQDEDDSPDKLIVKANLFVTEYNFIQALELYDTVLKENPENTFAMIGKANTLLTMRDMKTAIDQYDDVLEIDPNHTNALNGKANALLQSEKPEFAINLYDQTLKIDSQNTNAMIGKSLAFIALGEQQQALSLLDMVLKVNPDNLHAKELKSKYG